MSPGLNCLTLQTPFQLSASHHPWSCPRSCSGQRSTKTRSTSDRVNKDIAPDPAQVKHCFLFLVLLVSFPADLHSQFFILFLSAGGPVLLFPPGSAPSPPLRCSSCCICRRMEASSSSPTNRPYKVSLVCLCLSVRLCFCVCVLLVDDVASYAC